MSILFRPPDAWAGDFIPFWWDGEFHLFFLHDDRAAAEAGGTPWFHVSTRDFVSFRDHGLALPPGGRNDPDLYVFTGSVIERHGTFHIYYTGYNPFRNAAGDPEQVVMHATSRDLVTWIKDPANPIVAADTRFYEPDDWRDPFVFWNAEDDAYWMLLAARVRIGPKDRRGCIALAVSPDLVHWEVREPFWSPYLAYTHECPDLFRDNTGWHLVFSTFSDRFATRHRTAEGLAGPWRTSADDALDGPAFYAAKTASDGRRRFAFGWIPTRAGGSDDGHWQWGGQLVVHEVVPSPGGRLALRAPAEIAQHFAEEAELTPAGIVGTWAAGDEIVGSPGDGFGWYRLGAMPDSCLLQTTVVFSDEMQDCGVVLRADDNLDRCYQLRLEPRRQRVVFDRRPHRFTNPFLPEVDRAFGNAPDFVVERPVSVSPGVPVHLRVIVDGSAIVAYIDDVGLTARGYDYADGSWGLFVTGGTVRFRDSRLLVFSAPSE